MNQPPMKLVKGIGLFLGSFFVEVEVAVPVALFTLVASICLVGSVALKPPWLPNTLQLLRHVAHCQSGFSSSSFDCCQVSGALKFDGSSFAQCF